MNLRALLLDLDGTRVDSLSIHSDSWVRAFSDFGIPFDPHETFVREGEKSLTIARAVIERETAHPASPSMLEAIHQKKNDYADEAFQLFLKTKGASAIWYPNANELLQWARTHDLMLAVVTGATHIGSYVDVSLFDAVITGVDVTLGKPHPEPYEKALSRLHLQPDEAITLENAPLGIRAAKSAGTHCIAVMNNTVLTEKQLREAGSDVVLKDLGEVISHLDGVFASSPGNFLK